VLLVLLFFKLIIMAKEIKPLGMVHIPGVNDEAWKQFLIKQEQTKQVKSNLWYHLP
jgi:rhamnogalacturonyl hydrolase YesR